MTTRYPIYAADEKSELIDATVDATYSTRTSTNHYMNKHLTSGTFTISCQDANGDLVTPTGGTFVVTAIARKDNGAVKQELTPSAGDLTIDATELINGLATYTVPTFLGPVLEVRVAASGITGAVTFKAETERFV